MKHKQLACFLAGACLSGYVAAQPDWNLGGNGVTLNTDYLGCNAGSTFPLHLRTIPNLAINQSTSNILRSRLYPTQTSNFNATYPAVQQDGFFALSGQPNFFTDVTSPGAFSRLHLVDQAGNPNPVFYAPTAAYRGWMRNGITMTGNADMGYLGQKYNALDRTDMVLHWSNDAGSLAFAPDRLRIMFSTAQDGALSGATSFEGLEAARFYPPRATEVFMGLGDFFAGNLVDPLNIIEPTERLDILNGRVRIRQLPDDLATDSAYKVMVVDDTNDPLERGVVKWKDLSSLVDCDWVVQTPIPHVSTAYAGSTCDTQEMHGVAIGYQYPKTKLDVYHMDNTYLDPIAIRGDARFEYENGETVVGVHGQSSTPVTATTIPAMRSIGVEGTAFNGKWSTGVKGFASCAGATEGGASRIVGVSGEATADNNADVCIGVYGTASGSTGGDWAAVFEGAGYLSAGLWVPSDQGLKQNIEAMDRTMALENIIGLNPRTYTFNPELVGTLSLPTGVQRGFMSQEVEEIMPDLVKNYRRPAVFDSTGAEVEPPVDIKAMNYEGLIPLLVAAFQEEHQRNAALQAQVSEELDALRTVVQEQRTRLDQAAELLAACCSNPDLGRSIQQDQAPLDGSLESDPKLRIHPNPFNERTTVYYTLERTGRAQLLANSADGKELRVLHESQLEAGPYQYEWDTTELAAGLYYVTLLLDGKPVVKKAVKVAR